MEVGAASAVTPATEPAEDEGDDEADEHDQDEHEEDDHDRIVPRLPLHDDRTRASALRGRTFAPGQTGADGDRQPHP